MTPERHQRIGQLYHQALELEPGRRAAFVVEACSGDESLRREVEALLALDERAEGFLESPALEVTAQLLAEERAQSIVGRRVAHYEVLSLLGAGGMGEVYLARDTRLGRQIALKLLPNSLTENRERVRRFEQEARAVSALNHPNIITIHEIVQDAHLHYIATEFIDGQTLRQRLMDERLPLGATLDIAIQVASALSAAHDAGIVHRDIKPENVMMRRDGFVKVLDFGLAKLTEQRTSKPDTDAPTIINVTTEPGTVMGTACYMSPEQARGEKVDARSDIFSFGVVLYEMIAGKAPFEGVNAIEVLGAILNREPAPLHRHATDAPAELQRIVNKALHKDLAGRYQASKELLLDLKTLKQELDFEERLKGTQISTVAGAERAAERRNTQINTGTAAELAAQTAEGASAQPTSGVQTILRGLTRHRLGFVLVAIVVVAVAAFYYFNRTPPLTEKDTILLTDFSNSTGEAVFDGTLKQALAVHLGQSPFLNIFSDERVREVLRYMGRSPDEPVTRAVAREVCERQGIKALLSGSIASLGRHYVITLEAVNPRSGEILAREQVEAEGKEQVLRYLGQAATSLRGKLGESLPSLERFDAPLEQVTTSSLEAFRAFSLGIEQVRKNQYIESIPFFKRATELDPKFAVAYSLLSVSYANARQLGLAAESAEKAFHLRDRVSERENFEILLRYYDFVTKEIDKTIEVAELWEKTYPRDWGPRARLCSRYQSIGQFEKAITKGREAINLRPNFAAAYSNLARGLVRLNRFDEAKGMFEQAVAHQADSSVLHQLIYEIAFVQRDAAAMQQQIDWASGTPLEYQMVYLQAEKAAFEGRWRQARELSRRAVEMGQRGNRHEDAAVLVANTAVRGAIFGYCQPIRESTENAGAMAESSEAMTRQALTLGLCGEVSQAQLLANELVKRDPKATLLKTIWLPVIQAAISLRQNNPAQAIRFLEAVGAYETGAQFWPTYLRAQAYLQLRQGAEAVAEFQKIIDHRGWDPTSTLYPLAQLGLAQAAALTGDTDKSRQAYQNFLALWKDADPDLAILVEARKEYEKMK